MTSRLFKERETCDYLNVSRALLAKQRSEGARRGETIIPFVKIGKSVRYDIQDLDEYIAQHKHDVAPAS